MGNDKIELVKCPQDCSHIKIVLAKINSFFHEAEHYQYSKEYYLSIVSLKKAFEKTFELRNSEEQECARFFRLIIIESLSNIHRDLKNMTSGCFRKRGYIGSYLMAEETLEIFKKNALQVSSEN